MLPWLLCGALALLSLLLLLRLAALHRSLDELRAFFAQNIAEESNGLIRLSSRDPHARRCASGLNAALRELREQRHAYLSGDRELKNAVVNVSHDLRTPLTAICGYVELLEREELSPDAARYVAVIGERAEAMRTLCEERFRYSLVSAQEQQLHPEVLALNAALQESFAAAYTMLKERGITPEISLPETDVQRTLDRAALMRIFSNLLSNAAKYSDGDLDITLSEPCVITFSNQASQLTVTQVERLFDRFYTVEMARSSTGLGLSIARTLIEQMGGTISADLEAPRLTITIRL